MKIELLESKYNYKFSKIFKNLWNNGMLDWMGGRTVPFDSGENWAKSVYPLIKNHPPLLLHTGGFDFQMFSAKEMLDFKYDEFWDIETHTFIPFAKTEEGAIYAFYENIKSKKGESAVVCIWNDMNETEVLAKNFEDFIFRKMVEAVYDIDKDELSADYKEDGFKNYRLDILKDLLSISPYISDEYRLILEEIYNREEVIESMISYSLLGREELAQLIQNSLSFKELNCVFEHEID